MTTSTPTQTVLEGLQAEVSQTMQKEYQKAAQIQDPSEMVKAIQEVTAKVNTLAKTRYNKLVTDRKTKADQEKLVAGVFQGVMLDAFKTVWASVPEDTVETVTEGNKEIQRPVKGKSLKQMAGELSTVPSFIFRVDRADAGNGALGEPTVVLGSVKVLGSGGTGNTRSHKITVDDKEYVSVNQAWKAIMVTLDGKVIEQPTEEVGGKQSKTRKAAIAGFKAAGKNVVE